MLRRGQSSAMHKHRCIVCRFDDLSIIEVLVKRTGFTRYPDSPHIVIAYYTTNLLLLVQTPTLLKGDVSSSAFLEVAGSSFTKASTRRTRPGNFFRVRLPEKCCSAELLQLE